MSQRKSSFKTFLADLIAFDTISSKSNLALIDYLQSFLEEHGFQCQRHYNDDRQKANLLAVIGPKVKGGMLLAGHTDVVPIDGQPWDYPPFKLTEKDDRLIGRGTTDMKGYIALVCDAIESNDLTRLKKPLCLAFTYDEEIGCLGAKALQNELLQASKWIDFALIGEPTNFKLVNAHKGIKLTKTYFTGKPAHSSCPHLGQNAIMAAASFLENLSAVLPKNQNARFNPSFTTFNAGTISGGNACNIIAEHCQLEWECRPLPEVESVEIDNALNALTKDVSMRTEVGIKHENIASVPGLTDVDNEPYIQFLKSFLPKDIPVTTAPFVTEAGLFQQASIPTVVFGPGELEQAHQPNESVSIKLMENYHLFLMDLFNHFCHS